MKAYIFTALVFASSAALADDARILAKCEGDNGITAALRYDPVPDPTYDNDRITWKRSKEAKRSISILTIFGAHLKKKN